jgi:hypothetical protein
MVNVYTEQKDFLDIYAEQLARWKLSSPSVSQNQEPIEIREATR